MSTRLYSRLVPSVRLVDRILPFPNSSMDDDESPVTNVIVKVTYINADKNKVYQYEQGVGPLAISQLRYM